MSRGSTVLAGQVAVTVALFAVYSGLLSVLLPQQVATLAPQDKVAALAMVTSVSFAVTAFAQPLFGVLSDRTRSPWGRRVPWMVGCAVAGGALVILLPTASAIVSLIALWAAAQFVLNGTDIAVSAYLVDRFRPERRGAVVGAIGVAVVLGGALGVLGAGAFGMPWGNWVLAGALVLAVLAFALVVRDAPPATIPPPAEPTPPVPAPSQRLDLVWVLASRLLLTIGYGSVHGFLLYVLTDHVGLTGAQAVGTLGQATLIGGAGLVVAVLGSGLLSDRAGRRKPFVVAAGLSLATGDAVLLVFPSTAGVLVAALLLGVGLGLFIASGTALVSVLIPGGARNAAGGLGVFNFVGNAGQAAAPLVTAAVVALTGGYAWVFAVSGILALAASAAVTLVRSAR